MTIIPVGMSILSKTPVKKVLQKEQIVHEEVHIMRKVLIY